jgi:hypothetical protein
MKNYFNFLLCLWGCLFIGLTPSVKAGDVVESIEELFSSMRQASYVQNILCV